MYFLIYLILCFYFNINFLWVKPSLLCVTTPARPAVNTIKAAQMSPITAFSTATRIWSVEQSPLRNAAPDHNSCCSPVRSIKAKSSISLKVIQLWMFVILFLHIFIPEIQIVFLQVSAIKHLICFSTFHPIVLYRTGILQCVVMKCIGLLGSNCYQHYEKLE